MKQMFILIKKHYQLYIIRSWDSETTFLNLPKKLCQFLITQIFHKNVRFLLKGSIQEIKTNFITLILYQLMTKAISDQFINLFYQTNSNLNQREQNYILSLQWAFSKNDEQVKNALQWIRKTTY